MRDQRTRYRCPECGEMWDGHSPACQGHKYKPPIRRDLAGRDVTEMPGLWDETDTFHFTTVQHYFDRLRSTFFLCRRGLSLWAAWKRSGVILERWATRGER